MNTIILSEIPGLWPASSIPLVLFGPLILLGLYIWFWTRRDEKIAETGEDVQGYIVGYIRHDAEKNAIYGKNPRRDLKGNLVYFLVSYEDPSTGGQIVKKYAIALNNYFLPDLLVKQITFRVSATDRLLGKLTSNPDKMTVPDWGMFETLPDDPWVILGRPPKRMFLYPWPVPLKVVPGGKFIIVDLYKKKKPEDPA